jgi:ATP-dependent RNA helicase RhlE
MMNQNHSQPQRRRRRFRHRRNRDRNRGQSPNPAVYRPAQAAARPPQPPVSIDVLKQDGNVFSGLLPEIQRALVESGYTRPTPVQEQCIPHLLAGRDLLGSAQTGTGKTAAFTLPLLQYLTEHPLPPMPRRPRVLVLAPTRELAAQIGESVATYGKHLDLSHTVIFGGVGQNPQEKAMNEGVDILVATPGRLLDLMNQGFVQLDGIEAFVLDEADRMLDMGFIHDVQRVIAELPSDRQSLFFSATLPSEVVELANTLLTEPVRVTIAPEQPTVERVEQKVLFVDKNRKDALLVSLFEQPSMDKAIVFVQRKRVAGQVTQKLQAAGISAAVIHGDKSQSQRMAALANFRLGRIRALVATDIAARGLDVDGITHVINYELPVEAETYVHRIGRTARAGEYGDAVSFCMASERHQLRLIERLIRKSIFVDREHPFHSDAAENAAGDEAKPAPRGAGGGGQGRRGGGRKKWKNKKKASSPQLQSVSPVLRRLQAGSRNGYVQGNREGANRSRPFAGPRRNPRNRPNQNWSRGW